ncbi:MAG: LAGLIDADG family homing endonuclease [Nanoarchaeota archaeon]
MDKEINSGYVRGFFDGEGCPSVKGKQIIITNQNFNILKGIKKKLSSLGIISRLKNDKNCYRLKIHGYNNLLRFVKLIGSNMQEKRKKLLAIINSYSHYPISKQQIENVRTLRKKGRTFRQIAKMTKVSVVPLI